MNVNSLHSIFIRRVNTPILRCTNRPKGPNRITMNVFDGRETRPFAGLAERRKQGLKVNG
nr:MAG TPA: hypothetical protein [Caudoviricetes sp.]